MGGVLAQAQVLWLATVVDVVYWGRGGEGGRPVGQ